MRNYRAEQVVKWLDKKDGWRLPKWRRKMLKEFLTGIKELLIGTCRKER